MASNAASSLAGGQRAVSAPRRRNSQRASDSFVVRRRRATRQPYLVGGVRRVDKSRREESTFRMKASVLPLCLLLCGAPAAFAQTSEASASTAASGPGTAPPAVEPASSGILPPGGLQLEVTRVEPSARATGPLVDPFRGGSATEAPKKVLNLFNPFASVTPQPVVTRSRGLTSRSWAGVVGWNPGRSQFADERTHQIGVTLVSLRRGP